MSSRKNDFILQGSILAAAGIITRFIGLIYRAPLTRIVGTEGMAYYNTAYEIYNLVLLLSTYSVPVAVSKLISSFDAKKQYKNSLRTSKIAFIISLSIGGAGAVLLFAFARPLASAMGWPSAAIPLRVLAPTVFVFSVMGVIRGLFQGKRTMIPTSISQLIEQTVNAIVSVVAALLLANAYADSADAAAYAASGGTAGTLFGAIAGALFLFLILWVNKGYFAKQKNKDISGVEIPDGQIAKMVLLTMLPIILGQSVYQLSGIIDNTMFGRIMEGKHVIESDRAVIWEAYSNRFKWLSNLPVAIATAFGVSIVPMVANSYSQNNLEDVKTKIRKAVKLNMLIAIPSAAGLFAIAKPVINLVFGDVGENLSPKLMMLGATAVIFFAYSTITNGILQGVGRLRTPVIHAAISLAVHVIFLYVMLKYFDLSAYGLVIGNVTYALLVSILNYRSIEVNLEYRQEIRTTFLIPLASSVVMGLIARGVYELVHLAVGINAIGVVFALVFAIPAYFVGLLLLKGVTKEEVYDMPKGRFLVKVAVKLRLLKPDEA